MQKEELHETTVLILLILENIWMARIKALRGKQNTHPLGVLHSIKYQWKEICQCKEIINNDGQRNHSHLTNGPHITKQVSLQDISAANWILLHTSGKIRHSYSCYIFH